MLKTKLMTLSVLVFLTSCTSLKIKIGAKMTIKNKDSLENVMNIRPNFIYKSNGWSSMFKQNMNDAWKKLNIKGINYFLLGKPRALKGYVSRSDIKSKFYQAWFGTYIIQANEDVFSIPNEKINESPLEGIMEYGKVAEHDQIAWLIAMGDKNPVAKSISYVPIIQINIDGQVVQLFEGTIESHSDLSEEKTSLNKLLGMPKANKWREKVEPFHNITLKGIYCIWYNKNDRTIKIIYGCGSILKFKDGTTVDYYTVLKNDLIKMFQNVTFEKLK
jgi:hypothetical protein